MCLYGCHWDLGVQFALYLELPSGVLSQSCKSLDPLSPACKLVHYRVVDPTTYLVATVEGGLLEAGIAR